MSPLWDDKQEAMLFRSIAGLAAKGGPVLALLGVVLAVAFWIAVPAEVLGNPAFAEWPVSMARTLPWISLGWGAVGVTAAVGGSRARRGVRRGWRLLSVSVGLISCWFFFAAVLGMPLFNWMTHTESGQFDSEGLILLLGAVGVSLAAGSIMAVLAKRMWDLERGR